MNKIHIAFGSKNGDVQVSMIFWGTWSCGDAGTWHWSDDEMPALEDTWKLVTEHAMTLAGIA